MEFQKQQQESSAMAAAAAGSWVRGSVIGAGSFGTVSLAVSRIDGSLFAVKSIEFDPQHNGAELQALENEMSILQSISSPHVVRCLGGDWSMESGNHAMRNAFLEYMPGGSVADLMAKFGGRLDESLVRVYTRGILQGLSFLHGNGIVHCDIKGKNLLVGSTGLKLADFGSAKRIQVGDDRIAAMKGTPLWMAPEVVRQEEQGPASDIWSLGCTVVEMLTGKAPWGDAASAFVALYRIGCSDEVPEIPSFLSSQGKDFLARCLNRDPSRRPTAEELLQHPFVTETRVEAEAEPAVPLSPRSPLDFSKWQEESSSSPRLPTLALKKSSSQELDLQAAESTTTSSCCCSPKWIVVRSPQGRSQAQKAFDLLSDFDGVPAEPPVLARSSSSFFSSVEEIAIEKDCNALDEQLVASSADSSMASEEEIIVVSDSCSPSGQSGVVSEQLVPHPLFLGCGFLHSIHQSSSEAVRFLGQFPTDFRSSQPLAVARMPRAKIKRKLKRILLGTRFKQIAHCRSLLLLLELCSIISRLDGRIFSRICHVRCEPELREWPRFKKFALSCGNVWLCVVLLLPFDVVELLLLVRCHVHVCSRALALCACDWTEFDGQIQPSYVLPHECNLVEISWLEAVTPRRGSRSQYGEVSMTWTGPEMNPETSFPSRSSLLFSSRQHPTPS